jgi:hypothetical protein
MLAHPTRPGTAPAPSFTAGLGTFCQNGTLILNGGEANTYQDSGDDINCNSHPCPTLHYRVYPQGSPSGSFNTIQFGYVSGDGNPNKLWNATVANVNLLSGLSGGNYTLDVWFDATDAYSGGTVMIYDNNGGANYQANFTVNALPTAPDAARVRAPGGSLKILISDLGTSASVTGLGSGSHGATITKDSTYIYYLPVTGDANDDLFTYTVTDGGCPKSGNITVTVVKAGGVAQHITSSGGAVVIIFAGIPDCSYDAQRCADTGFSRGVTTMLTTNAPAAGVFTFTDTPPRNSAYYRLIQH